MKRKINAGAAATPQGTSLRPRKRSGGGARSNEARDCFVAVSREWLAELEADRARLDALEREVREDPLTLHNIPVGAAIAVYGRGLGLAPTKRTLRQAIDDLVGKGRR